MKYNYVDQFNMPGSGDFIRRLPGYKGLRDSPDPLMGINYDWRTGGHAENCGCWQCSKDADHEEANKVHISERLNEFVDALTGRMEESVEAPVPSVDEQIQAAKEEVAALWNERKEFSERTMKEIQDILVGSAPLLLLKAQQWLENKIGLTVSVKE